jgi:hypothetical protein
MDKRREESVIIPNVGQREKCHYVVFLYSLSSLKKMQGEQNTVTKLMA